MSEEKKENEASAVPSAVLSMPRFAAPVIKDEAFYSKSQATSVLEMYRTYVKYITLSENDEENQQNTMKSLGCEYFFSTRFYVFHVEKTGILKSINRKFIDNCIHKNIVPKSNENIKFEKKPSIAISMLEILRKENSEIKEYNEKLHSNLLIADKLFERTECEYQEILSLKTINQLYLLLGLLKLLFYILLSQF